MLLGMIAAVAFAQADVLAIHRECHIPASWMHLDARPMRARLHMRPSRNQDYAKVDCMLNAVKNIGEARGELPAMGFVGNEAQETAK